MSALSLLECLDPDSELANHIQSAPQKAESIYLNVEKGEILKAFEKWQAKISKECKRHQASLEFINRELEQLCKKEGGEL